MYLNHNVWRRTVNAEARVECRLRQLQRRSQEDFDKKGIAVTLFFQEAKFLDQMRYLWRSACAYVPELSSLFFSLLIGLLNWAPAVCQTLSLDEIEVVLKSNPPGIGNQALRTAALLDLDQYLAYDPGAPSNPEVVEFYEGMMSDLAAELSQPVTSGARIWQMYNQGYIVKTPSSTIAFDLINGYSGSWQKIPDSVLSQIQLMTVSHWYNDHSDSVVQSIIESFGGEILRTDNFPLNTETTFGNLSVVASAGTHSAPPGGVAPLNYIYTITTPEGLSIMHTGDTQSGGLGDLPTNKPVDILLVNGYIDRSDNPGVRNAARKVSSSLAIPGHLNELGHGLSGRVRYEASLEDDGPTPGEIAVLAWGERYDFELNDELEFEPTLWPQTTYNIADLEHNGTPGGGVLAREQSGKMTAAVGEIDLNGSDVDDRLIVKFALPEARFSPPVLERATLRFYLEDIVDAPAKPVSLFHSATDNAAFLEPSLSEFENSSYVDTLLDLVGPSDPTGNYYELDVTDFVLADYAQGEDSPWSAFRLQFEQEFVDDGSNPHYLFSTGGLGNGNPPQLLLKFVTGDFNSDDSIDGADFLEWQRGGSSSPLSISDLAVWESSFGSTVPTSSSTTGDFNDDGSVDGADFLEWQRGGSTNSLSLQWV